MCEEVCYPDIDPTFQNDRYHLIRLLGKGSSGKVFLAEDRETSDLVAIKILTSQVEIKIRREKEIPRVLGFHPSIVQLLDVFEKDDKVYFVYQYIEDGNSLETWKVPDIYQKPGLRIVINLMVDLVIVYQYIHSQGVVHRDIKADNILIKDNKPYITDWDLSCLSDPKDGIICSGIAGTPHYLAPELWKQEKYDPFRSDIYSLGVMFYALINQQLPYQGLSVNQIRDKILRHQVKNSSSGIIFLDHLVMKMISTNPQDRPSLSEVEEDLNRYLSQM